jgi:hypothetical protein
MKMWNLTGCSQAGVYMKLKNTGDVATVISVWTERSEGTCADHIFLASSSGL